MNVPFNIPYSVGTECSYIQQAFENKQLSGDGIFTKKVTEILSEMLLDAKVLLTHSCTAALEMCALLLDLKPGDEIIMPSFTFVSTANAFVLRGAIPVFVDIDAKTQNIDITKVEGLITSKTKAVVAVHYAGISCDLEKLKALCLSNSIALIEDAAQAIFARYNGKPLGTYGDLSTFSFHETKNISCGEGGCLVVNNPDYYERAEIIREKGTNRSKFYRGQVDKYTWIDQGSSYLPGEVSAAFLYAQLEKGESITQKRLQNWQLYDKQVKNISNTNNFPFSSMYVPAFSEHNAHMYYLVANNKLVRASFIDYMKKLEISCLFHYVPLHSSPAGKKFCRYSGCLNNTNRAGDCLVRLPMGPFVNTDIVLNALGKFCQSNLY